MILAPLALYPVVGMCISAYLKSVSTSRNLHRDYFLMKQMTPAQCARWIEERKWEYRVFGFFAGILVHLTLLNVCSHTTTQALLEGLPIIGLLFSVSNRVGAAMWAFGMGCMFLVFFVLTHFQILRNGNISLRTSTVSNRLD